jgi:hypothetical protein
MKQAEGKNMEAGYRASRYVSPSDEWTEAKRWEGYEFWSTQVEADLDFLADLQQTGVVANRQQSQEERDVFPF